MLQALLLLACSQALREYALQKSVQVEKQIEKGSEFEYVGKDTLANEC